MVCLIEALFDPREPPYSYRSGVQTECDAAERTEGLRTVITGSGSGSAKETSASVFPRIRKPALHLFFRVSTSDQRRQKQDSWRLYEISIRLHSWVLQFPDSKLGPKCCWICVFGFVWRSFTWVLKEIRHLNPGAQRCQDPYTPWRWGHPENRVLFYVSSLWLSRYSYLFLVVHLRHPYQCPPMAITVYNKKLFFMSCMVKQSLNK